MWEYSIVLFTQFGCHGWVLSDMAVDILDIRSKHFVSYRSGHMSPRKKRKTSQDDQGDATVSTIDDTSAARNMVMIVSTC